MASSHIEIIRYSGMESQPVDRSAVMGILIKEMHYLRFGAQIYYVRNEISIGVGRISLGDSTVWFVFVLWPERSEWLP